MLARESFRVGSFTWLLLFLRCIFAWCFCLVVWSLYGAWLVTLTCVSCQLGEACLCIVFGALHGVLVNVWSLHGGYGFYMRSCFTIEFEGVLVCHFTFCMLSCLPLSLHGQFVWFNLHIAESMKLFLSLGLHGGLSKVEFCMEMRVLSRDLEVILTFYVLAWLDFRMGLA